MSPAIRIGEQQPVTKLTSRPLPALRTRAIREDTVCRRISIRTIFKSSQTLRQLLTVKMRTLDLVKEVVYKIPCQDCETYIGETIRSLRKRIAEHKYAVKSNDRRNGIAVHAWDNQHRPDWDAADILESHDLDPEDHSELQSGLRSNSEQVLDAMHRLTPKVSFFCFYQFIVSIFHFI